MNITFEEANKIRQALQPDAKQNERYEAIGILDRAETKQREKNAKTIKYIQDKRKADKNYARPKNKPIVVTRKTPCDNDCIKCETMRICPIAWKKAEKGEL